MCKVILTIAWNGNSSICRQLNYLGLPQAAGSPLSLVFSYLTLCHTHKCTEDKAILWSKANSCAFYATTKKSMQTTEKHLQQIAQSSCWDALPQIKSHSIFFKVNLCFAHMQKTGTLSSFLLFAYTYYPIVIWLGSPEQRLLGMQNMQLFLHPDAALCLDGQMLDPELSHGRGRVLSYLFISTSLSWSFHMAKSKKKKKNKTEGRRSTISK